MNRIFGIIQNRPRPYRAGKIRKSQKQRHKQRHRTPMNVGNTLYPVYYRKKKESYTNSKQRVLRKRGYNCKGDMCLSSSQLELHGTSMNRRFGLIQSRDRLYRAGKIRTSQKTEARTTPPTEHCHHDQGTCPSPPREKKRAEPPATVHLKSLECFSLNELVTSAKKGQNAVCSSRSGSTCQMLSPLPSLTAPLQLRADAWGTRHLVLNFGRLLPE